MGLETDTADWQMEPKEVLWAAGGKQAGTL